MYMKPSTTFCYYVKYTELISRVSDQNTWMAYTNLTCSKMNLHINGLIDYCSAAIVRDSFTLWKRASFVTVTLEDPQGNRCSLSLPLRIYLLTHKTYDAY